MSIGMWVFWGFVLIAQNFSFTFVSRARNSGSIALHIKAALASNGIWFISQLIVVSQFMNIISGKYGVGKAAFALVFYTAFTITGSVAAHYYALRTEKGMTSVGANKKFVQITTEEYEKIKKLMAIIPDVV